MEISFGKIAIFLFGNVELMNFSILASQKYFLSVLIPAEIINFKGSFIEAIRYYFIESY